MRDDVASALWCSPEGLTQGRARAIPIQAELYPLDQGQVDHLGEIVEVVTESL
jgi:hypothetical protein